MQAQMISTGLGRALHKIVYYKTPYIVNEDIRAICTNFIKQDASSSFATYMFDVLPQINNVFDFIAHAKQELDQVPGIQEPSLVETDDFSLQSAVDWIVAMVEPVSIFKLGAVNFPEESVIDLLIVLPKNSKRNFKDYSLIINSIQLKGREIRFSLFLMQQLRQHVYDGSIYYMNACQPENLVYHNGAEELPDLDAVDRVAVKEKSAKTFNKGFLRSLAFREGAELFRTQGRAAMAAFMLHQSAEMIIRSAIMGIAAVDFRNHSIKGMLKQCSRYVPNLCTVFYDEGEMNDSLLIVLDSAYVKARYQDGFAVEDEELDQLFDKVHLMQQRACELVTSFIEKFPTEDPLG